LSHRVLSSPSSFLLSCCIQISVVSLGMEIYLECLGKAFSHKNNFYTLVTDTAVGTDISCSPYKINLLGCTCLHQTVNFSFPIKETIVKIINFINICILSFSQVYAPISFPRPYHDSKKRSLASSCFFSYCAKLLGRSTSSPKYVF
jgi:hypothetical protein